MKSNAIVFAREGQTVGIGAGQMSRVDSVKIAVIKADTAGLALGGSVVASDAFFPFPDGVEEAGKGGRDGRCTAGRVRARCRRDRGSKQNRNGYGFFRRPPLPSLGFSRAGFCRW